MQSSYEYLRYVAPIAVLAAGERATGINARVLCGRVLALLSLILPTRKLVRVLPVKAHRLFSALRKSAAIGGTHFTPTAS